jgi:3-hydroxybutyryl-CoA dehydrogenase
MSGPVSQRDRAHATLPSVERQPAQFNSPFFLLARFMQCHRESKTGDNFTSSHRPEEQMDSMKIAIIGSGLMGLGIASQFALDGYKVVIHDIDPVRLESAKALADDNFKELMEAGRISRDQRRTAISMLFPTSELGGVGDAAVVIEAVPEQLDLKRKIYRQLEQVIAEDAIIASNTSGFPPDLLCREMLRPERFLIAHFWNPPHLLPLVEIVPATRTRPSCVNYIKDQLEGIGLKPVVLGKAIPGFIGNRIQFAVLREALFLAREGIASVEDIDMVVQQTLGVRYQFAGPLAGADLGGLDTFAAIATHLMPELAKDEGVIDFLEELVAHNNTGLRSGQGFYKWTQERLDVLRENRRELLTRKGNGIPSQLNGTSAEI